MKGNHMSDNKNDQQGNDEKGNPTNKDGSAVESKHTAENIGKSEGGLPGQGQKGENEREDKRAS
jgi:hypothetical protein